MSGIGRTMRAAVRQSVFSGSLFGSGTLDIPVGVTEITLTGAGAPGGSDYEYHPGQPYVAEVPYTAGQPAVAAYWTWRGTVEGVITSSAPLPDYTGSVSAPTGFGQVIDPSKKITYNGIDVWPTSAQLYFGTYFYRVVGGTITSTYMSASSAVAQTAGQPYIAPGLVWWTPVGYGSGPGPHISRQPIPFILADIRLLTPPTEEYQVMSQPISFATTIDHSVMDFNPSGSYDIYSSYFEGQPHIPAVPMQPYIAPWETGGPYTGATASATFNGVTKDWVGGYYTTPPVAATHTIASTGAGQTLTYSVPAGASLAYNYTNF